MNKTQDQIPSMSKKDRRCRTLPYHHFKTVKRKLAGLRKWQEHLAGCPRRWN